VDKSSVSKNEQVLSYNRQNNVITQPKSSKRIKKDQNPKISRNPILIEDLSPQVSEKKKVYQTTSTRSIKAKLNNSLDKINFNKNIVNNETRKRMDNIMDNKLNELKISLESNNITKNHRAGNLRINNLNQSFDRSQTKNLNWLKNTNEVSNSKLKDVFVSDQKIELIKHCSTNSSNNSKNLSLSDTKIKLD